MALKKNEKPEWIGITEKVRAIREMGFAKLRDLAEAIGSPEQRLTEWINGKKEPRAEKALEIRNWVIARESEIKNARRHAEYLRTLTKICA